MQICSPSHVYCNSTSCRFNLKRHFFFHLSIQCVFSMLSKKNKNSCNVLRVYKYRSVYKYTTQHTKIFKKFYIKLLLFLYIPHFLSRGISVQFLLVCILQQQIDHDMFCLFIIYTTYRLSIIF